MSYMISCTYISLYTEIKKLNWCETFFRNQYKIIYFLVKNYTPLLFVEGQLFFGQREYVFAKIN